MICITRLSDVLRESREQIFERRDRQLVLADDLRQVRKPGNSRARSSLDLMQLGAKTIELLQSDVWFCITFISEVISFAREPVDQGNGPAQMRRKQDRGDG